MMEDYRAAAWLHLGYLGQADSASFREVPRCYFRRGAQASTNGVDHSGTEEEQSFAGDGLAH